MHSKNSILSAIAAAAALIPSMAAAQEQPLQAYIANIAEQNRDYAKIPHAMLKIQDVVYLADGDQAVLTGKKGEPQSWHWSKNVNAKGPLRVAFENRKLTARLNGKALAQASISHTVPIDTDIDVAGQPTQVGAGVIGWRIFVYNQKNPAALNFKGVSYYPFDPTFRVEARFIPDPKLTPRTFRTSRGTEKQFFHSGDALFAIKGTPVRLPLYAETGDSKNITSMTSFFTDALTGHGAYGAGRYVDVTNFGKYPPPKIQIDFNQAYNPNCARSNYFTCPVAIDNIPVAVKAGERDPHWPN